MKIMVTDNDHANMNQEDAVFQAAGLSYSMVQCKTEEDLIRECKGAEILLNQYAPITRKVMEALRPELKQVVRYGVGVNNVDVPAATELGVQICNVPDYGMNEVADHALAMLMALTRKVCLMNRYTREKWDYTHSIPIHRIPGSTFGIVCMGRIAQTLAKRLKGFDCRIISYDPYIPAEFVPEGVEMVSLDKLIRESDFISVHCPLNDDTYNMFNLETFKKMKNNAYIVNTARGGIINENDLFVALSKGYIAGAGLDVVEKEPMTPESRLFELDNFLCTPHMAWYSEEAAEELKRKTAEEAVRYAKGEKIKYPINKVD